MYGKSEYSKLIKDLISKGFKFKQFLSPEDHYTIYLRHDIDFSIKDALEIASLESDMGIRANYFFMITSNFYNCFSYENFNLIKRILNYGHSISLHFDPSCYENQEEGYQIEKAIFESKFNLNIKIISLHRPGKFLNSNNTKIGNCYHTYEDKFFREMSYYSDSGGKDIRKIIKKLYPIKDSKPIHLLLHPIWWTQKNKSPTSRLESFLKNNMKFLEIETQKNCKSYKNNN